MGEVITAWHFLAEDKALRYHDARVVEVGKTYSLPDDRDTELCKSGMHASIRAIDALEYAPGPIVCRVEVWGDLLEGVDKLVGRHRKVLAMADATRTLHEFAVAQARGALEVAGITDERCFAALEAKTLWLDGKITDDDLARARDAARDAAWVAGSAAAWDATRDAARDATRALVGRCRPLLGSLVGTLPGSLLGSLLGTLPGTLLGSLLGTLPGSLLMRI